MWNWSFPQCLTMYLLAQMRLASSASLESCSYSSETMWMHRGKSSTWVFLAPRSKMRILGSDGEECLTEYNTHYTVHAHAHTHMQHTHATHAHTHPPTHATHAHPPTHTTHQTHTHTHTCTPHAYTLIHTTCTHPQPTCAPAHLVLLYRTWTSGRACSYSTGSYTVRGREGGEGRGGKEETREKDLAGHSRAGDVPTCRSATHRLSLHSAHVVGVNT